MLAFASTTYDGLIVRFPNEPASGHGVLHYDFDESLGYHLCGAADALRTAINDELAGHGITFRQFQVIAWLVHEGQELSQAELAAKMMIEPPTLVGLLDRMEQQGWILRTAYPGDRRKKIIRPAPAAEAVWETMVEVLGRVRARATARLTPAQVESLMEMLQTVRESLAAPITEPASAAR